VLGRILVNASPALYKTKKRRDNVPGAKVAFFLGGPRCINHVSRFSLPALTLREHEWFALKKKKKKKNTYLVVLSPFFPRATNALIKGACVFDSQVLFFLARAHFGGKNRSEQERQRVM
jgi:hypothetical protein